MNTRKMYTKSEQLEYFYADFASVLLKAQNEYRIAKQNNNKPTVEGTIIELFWCREIEDLKKIKQRDIEAINNGDWPDYCECCGSMSCQLHLPFEHYYPGGASNNPYTQQYYNIKRKNNERF